MTSDGRYVLAHEDLGVNMLCRTMPLLCNMTEQGTAKFDDNEIETNWAQFCRAFTLSEGLLKMLKHNYFDVIFFLVSVVL